MIRIQHRIVAHTTVVFSFIGSALVFCSVALFCQHSKEQYIVQLGQVASAAIAIVQIALAIYCFKDCSCESTVDPHAKPVLAIGVLAMLCPLALSGYASIFHHDCKDSLLVAQAFFGMLMAFSPFFLR